MGSAGLHNRSLVTTVFAAGIAVFIYAALLEYAIGHDTSRPLWSRLIPDSLWDDNDRLENAFRWGGFGGCVLTLAGWVMIPLFSR